MVPRVPLRSPSNPLPPVLCVTLLAALCAATPASADIFQWEWINPNDHSLGKQASTTPVVDGVGVTAAPNAKLHLRDLTNAYLIEADLTSAGISQAALVNADLSRANLTRANLWLADLSGATLTQANLSSSYLSRAIFTNATLAHSVLVNADLQRAALSSANLSNSNLRGADLTDAHLSGANLRNAEIQGANLSRSKGLTQSQLYSTASYQARDLQNVGLGYYDLTAWSFAGQNLSGGGFEFTTLTGANLSGADARGTSFWHATLTGADFSGANIQGANFSTLRGFSSGGTGITVQQLYSTSSYLANELAGTDFGGNDLSGGDFAEKDLTGASFEQANLLGADFAGAQIQNARFDAGQQPAQVLSLAQLYSTSSYQQHDLRGISLGGAILTGSDFAGHNLTGAAFNGAILDGANFSGANLQGTVFSGASLNGADFTGSEVAGASLGSISPTQLQSTASYQQHELPGVYLTQSQAGVDLSQQNLTNVLLDGVDFSGMRFSGANLSHAIIFESKFDGADFSGANLQQTEFVSYGSSFINANFTGANLSNMRASDWQAFDGAVFDNAVLNNAQLTGSFIGASFRTASCVSAGFDDYSVFEGTDFTDANLQNSYITPYGCILHHADLRGAVTGSWPAPTTGPDYISWFGSIGALSAVSGETFLIRGLAPPLINDAPHHVNVTDVMDIAEGGALKLFLEASDWTSSITFQPGVAVQLNGTLELEFASGVDPAMQVGRVFRLFDWTGATRNGEFSVRSQFEWDLTRLYSSGEVTLTAVPEPPAIALALIALAGLPVMRALRPVAATRGGRYRPNA